MAFNPQTLIDPETGELDAAAIRDRADVLSCRDYGAPNYPPSYFRSHEMNVTDVARIMRVRWRAAHGLPDDTPCTMMQVPTLGK
jgi:hypothetical protein